MTFDPGKSISLEDFQATFKDIPIASSSLSETVIVYLSYHILLYIKDKGMKTLLCRSS